MPPFDASQKMQRMRCPTAFAFRLTADVRLLATMQSSTLICADETTLTTAVGAFGPWKRALL
jgi:hypothetical protein